MKKQASSLSASVQEQIIQIIISRGMKPGDRLDTEQELSKRLGVGRGTVREAVRGLVSRNILVARQGAGTFISPRQGVPNDPLGLTFLKHDQRLALDLLEVRLMLEPHIAQLAALNASEQEMRQIESQCDRVEQSILAKEPYRLADVEFHRLIAQASHNQVVGTLVPVIHSSSTLNIDFTHNELIDNTLKCHRQLAQCIRARDFEGARGAMVVHLSENRLFLKNHTEDQFAPPEAFPPLY